MGFVFLLVSWGLAYWIWPDEISDRPLSQITLKEIAASVFSTILAVGGVRSLIGEYILDKDRLGADNTAIDRENTCG